MFQFYEEMKRAGVLADGASEDLKATEKKLAVFGNRVDDALQAYKKLAEDIEVASAHLQDAFKEEDGFSIEILRKFSKYEKVALKLQKADLDDITRLAQPDMRVKIAVFVYLKFFADADMSAYEDETAALEVRMRIHTCVNKYFCNLYAYKSLMVCMYVCMYVCV